MRHVRRQAIFGSLLGACLFAASVACGQSGVAVSGRVLDQSTAAIADASVRLFSADQVLETKSDSDGRFELRGIPADSYDLEVGKAGFKPYVREGMRVAEEDIQGLAITLYVGEGSGRTVVTLKSAPVITNSISYKRKSGSSNLAGAVFDLLSGAPLPDANVYLSGSIQTQTLATNEKGEFQLSDLEPGRYKLTVTRDGYWPAGPSYQFWITRRNLTEFVIGLEPNASSQ